MIKILDCTLRDGGYYTNWAFNKSSVFGLIESLEKSGVDYCEVGYVRKIKKDNPPIEENFFSLDNLAQIDPELKVFLELRNISLGFMIDSKEFISEDGAFEKEQFEKSLDMTSSVFSLARIATDVKNCFKIVTA